MPPTTRSMVSIADLIVAVKLLEADEETPARIANLLGLVRTSVASGRSDALRSIQQPEVEVSATIGPAATLEKDQVVRDDEPSVTSRQVLSSTLSLVPSEGFAGFVSDPIPRQERQAHEGATTDPAAADTGVDTSNSLRRAVNVRRRRRGRHRGDRPEDRHKESDRSVATISVSDHAPRSPTAPGSRTGARPVRARPGLARRAGPAGRTDRTASRSWNSSSARHAKEQSMMKASLLPTRRRGRAPLVLVMTDLGIGRPPGWAEWASEAEWLEFALLLRKAGCPLVALVPYPSDRWPPALAASMMILSFDRRRPHRRCDGSSAAATWSRR